MSEFTAHRRERESTEIEEPYGVTHSPPRAHALRVSASAVSSLADRDPSDSCAHIHCERHCSLMFPVRIGILRSSPRRRRPSRSGVEAWQRKSQPPGNCTFCCNTSLASRCRSCCTRVSFVRASAGTRRPTCSRGTQAAVVRGYLLSVRPSLGGPRHVPGHPPTRQPAAPSGNREGARL